MADRLILDTCLVIAAERKKFDLRQVIGNDDPAVSAITAMELLSGVERASAPHRDVLAVNVEGFLARMSIETYTVNVARMHALLYSHARKIGRPRGAYDLIIAATAGATGRKLLTTDVAAGFEKLPGVRAEIVKLS